VTQTIPKKQGIIVTQYSRFASKNAVPPASLFSPPEMDGRNDITEAEQYIAAEQH
jgi:hypothetical protein